MFQTANGARHLSFSGRGASRFAQARNRQFREIRLTKTSRKLQNLRPPLSIRFFPDYFSIWTSRINTLPVRMSCLVGGALSILAPARARPNSRDSRSRRAQISQNMHFLYANFLYVAVLAQKSRNHRTGPPGFSVDFNIYFT